MAAGPRDHHLQGPDIHDATKQNYKTTIMLIQHSMTIIGGGLHLSVSPVSNTFKYLQMYNSFGAPLHAGCNSSADPKVRARKRPPCPSQCRCTWTQHRSSC